MARASRLAPSRLTHLRLCLAAHRAQECAVAYVSQRPALGRPVAQHGRVEQRTGDDEIGLAAIRCVLFAACRVPTRLGYTGGRRAPHGEVSRCRSAVSGRRPSRWRCRGFLAWLRLPRTDRGAAVAVLPGWRVRIGLDEQPADDRGGSLYPAREQVGVSVHDNRARSKDFRHARRELPRWTAFTIYV